MLERFRKAKPITSKSSGNSFVTEYVVIKRMKRVRDVKITQGEECFPQHSLTVMNLVLENEPI